MYGIVLGYAYSARALLLLAGSIWRNLAVVPFLAEDAVNAALLDVLTGLIASIALALRPIPGSSHSRV